MNFTKESDKRERDSLCLDNAENVAVQVRDESNQQIQEVINGSQSINVQATAWPFQLNAVQIAALRLPLVVCFILCVIFYYFNRRKSTKDATTRARLRSRTESRTLLETDRNEEHPGLEYWGPTVSQFEYATWIPPPSWKEASRRLVPKNIQQSTRKLGLQVQAPFLLHGLPAGPVPATQVSLHVVPPTQGGVLEILVEEQIVLEHTFDSALLAAQFQSDLFALQYIGPIIEEMYHAFELVHQGSICTHGQEFVCHDFVRREDTESSFLVTGIAWDDVVRCLGSTRMGRSLEDIWWLAQSKSTDHSETNSCGLKDEYVKKRLLMGPVDFFRLFVPLVPHTALPNAKSSSHRMQAILQLRQRAAEAAVLVKNYVGARTVANLGWSLGRSTQSDYLTRRVAYDDNIDNEIRDLNASNEYYEATVSRDVVLAVRNRKEEGISRTAYQPSRMSPMQGYLNVGMHAFRLPMGSELDFTTDLIAYIPSLRKLIEENPELDFFVASYFLDSQGKVLVQVFCRWLPKNVDPSFDRVVENFYNGNSDLRNQKLECILQVGVDRQGLSWIAKVGLGLFGFVLRLASPRQRLQDVVNTTVVDRIALPSFRVAILGATCHFGGAMSTDRKLPQNYVAVNTKLDSIAHNSIATRLMLVYLEEGGLSEDVLDINYILSASDSQELPERAFASIRLVRTSLKKIALPSSYLSPEENHLTTNDVDQNSLESDSRLSTYFRIFVTDPAVATVRSMTRGRHNPKLSPRKTPIRRMQTFFVREKTNIISTSDPFEQSINELVEILEEIKIPVRVEQFREFHRERSDEAFSLGLSHTISTDAMVQEGEGVIQVPILQTVSRYDIRRFFIASDCTIKRAAVRIVESACWRGLTFPIDTRACRIELQNGQFFHQGIDLEGNPVFYFRHTCLGPWRRDEDAVISAVLYQLESALQRLSKDRADVQITLIVMLGRPYRPKKKRKTPNDSITTETTTNASQRDEENGDGSEDEGETVLDEGTTSSNIFLQYGASNPRMPPDENWQDHTNKNVVKRLIHIAQTHYPERLRRALIVLRHGNKSYTRTAVGGALSLSKYVRSSRTRDKVRFLNRYADLRDHVAPDELITPAGGSAPVDPRAFQSG